MSRRICFPSGRRSFIEEFKTGFVDLVVSSGRFLAEVSSDLGIKDGTLGNWVRAWKVEHPDAGAEELGPVEWAKYKALQAENGAFKKEHEFLGKVSASFAAKQL
ncbi:transposase [Glutamicibacter ardleyensis]|uniref:transposase n=1 Tax=Glutamicibacter ardleyensis TaxID=225894 RepID=UPI003FD5D15E